MQILRAQNTPQGERGYLREKGVHAGKLIATIYRGINKKSTVTSPNGEKKRMKNCRCLKNLVLLLLFVSSSSALLHADGEPEVKRWEREAANATIIRDDWGIAHIHGL